MVNIWKRITKKVRRIILLHVGIMALLLHYGRTREPIIFMIFGFLDLSMGLKTNTIYLWRHQDAPNNSRKSQIIFEKYYLGKSRHSGNHCFRHWKRWGLTIPEDSLISLRTLNMGSISSRNHEMKIW